MRRWFYTASHRFHFVLKRTKNYFFIGAGAAAGAAAGATAGAAAAGAAGAAAAP